MRNLTIGIRLTLGFGVLILLLVLLAIQNGWLMMGTRDSNQKSIERQALVVTALELKTAIKLNTAYSLAAARAQGLTTNEDFDQEIQAATTKAATLVKSLDQGIQDPKARTLFQKLEQLRHDFVTRRSAALASMESGHTQDAQRFFSQEMPSLVTTYIDQVEAFTHYQTDSVNQAQRQIVHDIDEGLWVSGIATLLALVFSPWFARSVTRSITRPLNKAVQLATQVARRDLSPSITALGRDEITQLEKALDAMVTGLRETIGQVHGGANAIATAASQISMGNLDLSARTEQQSASLAQTAASMEEITATVRQNSDNAQQADHLSRQATQSAQTGGTTVEKLVLTMGDIHTKSQQIAEIVGVIDSIAFQTNILALNAAVEAARAGEQGRGFAVVAAEVRALAQRSANSAKEIKALIDTAAEVMAHGNTQAQQAGSDMRAIVDGIQRVSGIMADITTASHEQTTGIEQINVAITQMDDVTRQNASLVEESAAAASSLQEQADTLAQLVATFQIGTDRQARAGQTRHQVPMRPPSLDKAAIPLLGA
ncbi:methyl-accepting chemotaxis protein [Castellaniella caeni]